MNELLTKDERIGNDIGQTIVYARSLGEMKTIVEMQRFISFELKLRNVDIPGYAGSIAEDVVKRNGHWFNLEDKACKKKR